MKNEYKIIDADMHLREPQEAWDRCTDPELKRRGEEND